MKKNTECALCVNMSETEILDSDMMEILEVCKDCYNSVFNEVVNEGREYFYEWAVEMYGDRDKAQYLASLVFNEDIAEEDGETIMMFTYGILKYPYNLKREGALTIVENATISGHKLHLYASSFPITQKTGKESDKVYGTLFEIPLSVILHNYDHVEGYKPNRPVHENMYNREEVEVTTPNGEVVTANMYYANQNSFADYINNYTHIPTGNFDDKQLAKSYYGALRERESRNKKKSKSKK